MKFSINQQVEHDSQSQKAHSFHQSITSLDLIVEANNHEINWLEAIIHLLKGTIGTGIFSLPFAFAHTGTLGGLLFMILIAISVMSCLNYLLTISLYMRRKYMYGPLDYGNLCSTVFEVSEIKFLAKYKNSGKILVNGFLIFTQLGFCTSYLTFLTATVENSLPTFHIHSFHNERIKILAIIVVPIILLCLIRNLDFLAKFTLIGNLTFFAGLSILIYDFFDHLKFSPSDLPLFVGIQEWPIFFGNAIYSVEAIGVILPIENKMKKPYQFRPVLNAGIGFCFVVYTFVGFMGYIRFGKSVLAPVTSSTPSNIEDKIANMIFAVSIYTTYSLQFYVPVIIVKDWVNDNVRIIKSTLIKEYLLRITIVIFTFSVSAAIPQLGLFIALVGSSAGSFLSLILPAFMHFLIIKIDKDVKSKNLWYAFDVFVIIFGLIGAVTGTMVSIQDIINAYSGGNSQNTTMFTSTTFETTSSAFNVEFEI